MDNWNTTSTLGWKSDRAIHATLGYKEVRFSPQPFKHSLLWRKLFVINRRYYGKYFTLYSFSTAK